MIDDLIDNVTDVGGKIIEKAAPKTIKKPLKGEDLEVSDVVDDAVDIGIGVAIGSVLDDIFLTFDSCLRFLCCSPTILRRALKSTVVLILFTIHSILPS